MYFMFAFIVFIFLAIFLMMILSSCIRIVPQAKALVVERMGAYLDTWNVGVHFAVPFIDRVARKVNLKEQVADFAPQPVITKDNVTMRIDTVVFFQITDPKLFAYGVENPIMAIENLTATTLRNIIGELELDQTLTSRETINAKMRASLDEATDPWGIKVNRVERNGETDEGRARAEGSDPPCGRGEEIHNPCGRRQERVGNFGCRGREAGRHTPCGSIKGKTDPGSGR